MIGNALGLVLFPVHVTLWAGVTVYALVAGPKAIDAMELAEAQGAAHAGRRLELLAGVAA